MAITIDAIYENGVLKPAQALPLKEHEKVRVTVHSSNSPLLQDYGIINWQGDPDILRRLAISPEFDLEEEP